MTTLLHKTITHLTFSPDGTELLVNMGGEQIYLYDINGARPPVVSVNKRSSKTYLIINSIFILF